ncbi:hypothetical protein [Actinoplanes couchii]|nr:hypothetical protein [Actinoplanes couchii]
MGALRARSRKIGRGGAWLPALVLAALPVLSIVLYRSPFSSVLDRGGDGNGGGGSVGYPYWAGLPEQQRNSMGSFLFWMVAAPLAFTVVAHWYRRREREHGVRVAWKVPATANGIALFLLLALIAAPTGQPTFTTSWWQGLLTPLLGVAVAAIALGVVERSPGIALSGAWMAAVAWQFCAMGQVGGLFGWQTWVLGGGSGPALGGQLTILGLDQPGPALLFMSLPLLLTGLFRAFRARSAR